MRFSFVILLAVVFLGFSGSANAKSWRGLEPLRSTRADVERTLGNPELGSRNSYKTPSERVVVIYSEAECAHGWRVKPDTVISFSLYPTNVLPLSQIQLDESKIEKRRDVHIESLYFYVNQQDGLNYTVSKGVVTAIEYYPSAKDNSPRCDGPATPPANINSKPETTTGKPVTTEAENNAPVYACPMHPKVVSRRREFCHRCGMRLVLRRSRPAPKPKRSTTKKPAVSLQPKSSEGSTPANSAAARPANRDEFDVAYEYTCMMHPDVHRAQEGVCPKCNMLLVRVQPTVVGEYKVELELRPATLKPGEQAQLRFKIFNPQTGEPIKDYLVTHDKLFHLFIVSRDLSVYQHIHPELESDGSFSVATVLPVPGTYKVHADFFPRSGRPQIIHREITTAGAQATSATALPVMIPDANEVKTVDGMKVKLDLSASPRAGNVVYLNYHLTDAGTSEPVRDLQPYLGAWGHTLILNADQSQYLHSHPTGMIAETADRSTLRGGPEVTFMVIFPVAGDYRIWTQFQRGGKVSTVSYVVRVAP